eukprot:m.200711 g.200711  ORF g.200711 m.200711 type:complete len:700 (+) comp17697_c0_seq3:99-2198(+)
MASKLEAAFAASKAAGKPAFVGFVTGGFPTAAHTVPALLALQRGGATIIELGLPFSDPLADGATIQRASHAALAAGASLDSLLQSVAQARQSGLVVPVVLMGYFNPMLQYGIDKLAAKAEEVGIDGFIIVDLPLEEAGEVLAALHRHHRSFVPLVTPTTTDARIARLASVASSFVYCVSVAGVTGQRSDLPSDLAAFIQRIRAQTALPLAVGFGVSSRDHVLAVAQHAEGVVVGSALIAAMESAGPNATPEQCAEKLEALVRQLTGAGADHTPHAAPPATCSPAVAAAAAAGAAMAAASAASGSDEASFKFGSFGGRYIPETLVRAHEELWTAYKEAKADPAFMAELQRLREEYVGGPTPLYHAKRLTELCGGAQIWLKREDLCHTGAHKINNALGQVLLAKRLGKPRVIAETGAGQHGVATATACALMGLQCVVYMGAEDTRRQSLNVFRMKVLGAEVVPVTTGSQTLKDAINEAMRDWVTHVADTHYCVGSAIGPHPFPLIVRDLQCVIGRETRAQLQAAKHKLPDAVVACVGGGSNAIGMFHPFVADPSVRIVGVEAGGEGISHGKHSSTLVAGRPGVLHGTRTYLLQNSDGQIEETHSISAGLDYPGVGPEHSFLKDSGRATYVSVTDAQALEGFTTLSRTEGIIPALETAHAVYHGMQLAKTLPSDADIVINLSGRGDKDMITVAKALGVQLNL